MKPRICILFLLIPWLVKNDLVCEELFEHLSAISFLYASDLFKSSSDERERHGIARGSANFMFRYWMESRLGLASHSEKIDGMIQLSFHNVYSEELDEETALEIFGNPLGWKEGDSPQVEVQLAGPVHFRNLKEYEEFSKLFYDFLNGEIVRGRSGGRSSVHFDLNYSPLVSKGEEFFVDILIQNRGELEITLGNVIISKFLDHGFDLLEAKSSEGSSVEMDKETNQISSKHTIKPEDELTIRLHLKALQPGFFDGEINIEIADGVAHRRWPIGVAVLREPMERKPIE